MGWVKRYLFYAEDTEAPEAYHQMAAYWAIAAALGRNVWMDFGIYRVYPNLFAILVGPPAVKKGTSMDMAEAVLKGVPGVALGPSRTTRQGLHDELMDAARSVEVGGHKELGSPLSIALPELTNFIGYQDREFLDNLCQIFDGKDFKERTRKHGVLTVPNCCLNFIAGTTPSHLMDSLPPTAVGKGFTSRLLLVYSEKGREKRALPRRSEKQLRMGERLHKELADFASLRGPFWFDPEGEEFYIHWYEKVHQIPEWVDERLHSYYDRKHIHACKLALLEAVARRQTAITKEVFSEVLVYLESIEPFMSEGYGAVGASMLAPLVHKVLLLLRTHRNLTFSKLQRFLWRDASKRELEEALGTIEAMGKAMRLCQGESISYVYQGKEAVKK